MMSRVSRELINALLSDENGISDEAFGILILAVDKEVGTELWEKVNGVNGRWYFGKDTQLALYASTPLFECPECGLCCYVAGHVHSSCSGREHGAHLIYGQECQSRKL